MVLSVDAAASITYKFVPKSFLWVLIAFLYVNTLGTIVCVRAFGDEACSQVVLENGEGGLEAVIVALRDIAAGERALVRKDVLYCSCFTSLFIAAGELAITREDIYLCISILDIIR